MDHFALLFAIAAVLVLWGIEYLSNRADEEGDYEINIGPLKIEVMRKPPTGTGWDLVPTWTVTRFAGVLVVLASIKVFIRAIL